jgi:ABC-type branched-subunit amino acid transport system substrate-binding protein
VRPRQKVSLLSAALSVLLLSACGSTVQVSGSQQPGEALGGDGLGGESLGVPSSSPTSAGSPTSGSGVTLTPTTGASSSRGPGTTGRTPGIIGPTGSAQGVTAKAIYLGFMYDKNAGAVNKAVGVGSITSGDSKADTDAVIKDINAHGGIAGRRVVPVYAQVDSTSSQTLDQQYAAVCEQFTHDSPRVFAVDNSGNNTYRECLTKAGVLMLSNGLPEIGQAELNRYPGLIEQGYPNLDRLAAYFTTPLVAQKYFTPWDTVQAKPAAAGVVKVGILTYDDIPFSHAVDKILVPSLKRLGYTPVVVKITPNANAAAISGQAVAVKSAQLTFASNQVTHVIPFESNGGLSTLFLPVARTQGYYPRYGVMSAAGSEALNESGAVEKRQFNGAVGFGWLPAIDLPAALNPDNGRYSNANQRYCLKVMKDNGITFDSGNAKAIALNVCAALYLLKAALASAPAKVTLAGTLSLVEGLGTSYQRAGGIGQQFVPGRHDPTNRAYYWKFFNDCGCFHYDGPLQTVP